jgi:hypothetical protein
VSVVANTVARGQDVALLISYDARQSPSADWARADFGGGAQKSYRAAGCSRFRVMGSEKDEAARDLYEGQLMVQPEG